MYFRASSFSSTCPSTRTPAWLGYQAQHDDLIVVPPSVAAFSRTRTSAPSRSALSAAEKPAAPEPTTTTSTSWAKRVSSVYGRSAGWCPMSVPSRSLLIAIACTAARHRQQLAARAELHTWTALRVAGAALVRVDHLPVAVAHRRLDALGEQRLDRLHC